MMLNPKLGKYLLHQNFITFNVEENLNPSTKCEAEWRVLHKKLHIDIQMWAWILRDWSSRSKKIFYFVFILFVIQTKENKDLQIN